MGQKNEAIDAMMSAPKPQRDIKIEHVVYPDGSECDVIFTKMMAPIPGPELAQTPREKMMDFCLDTPVNTHAYDVTEEVVCLQDQPVPLRDGTTIYADIYLPKDAGPVPIIVSWSFFGKRPWEQPVNPMRPMGVPNGTVSDVTKFESADPLYWCYQGYGVANADPRGVGNSEGDLQCFGTQEGRDGYDFVEWLAEQEWCNGKVALFGNSGVGMSQWRIAAEQPPHLACFAPWEATGDMYRQSLKESGINGLFAAFIVFGTRGHGYIDNMVAMAEKEPFVTSPYWQDKIPNWKKIRAPFYACTNPVHFHNWGTWEGFNNTRSTKKWMRVHQDFEWPDTYSPKNLEDLKRFFDRYCKGIHNGWELTPRIRMEVMDAYDMAWQTDRPETKFPLPRTQYQRLYLDATNGALVEEPVTVESEVSYDSQTGECDFTYTFPEETELNGYMRLRLWVEARGNDDMDLFVSVKKDSTAGEELPVTIFGSERHPGQPGKLRVSMRAIDEAKSCDYMVEHTFDREEKIAEGEIVPIDINIWPFGRIWHKGQKLRIQIAGRYIRDEWFEPLNWATINKGEHVIHTGGRYESYAVIPVVPPRYQDGEFFRR